MDSSLFPLPLVAFERMMMLDDYGSYPMTCSAEFTFHGHFERESLETAYQLTTQRHPLLQAHIVRHRGRWAWIASDVPNRIRWVEPNGRPRRLPQIDLRSETGVQLSAVSRPEGTTLYFDFHHACVDGAGGLGFLEDLLQIYAILHRGECEDYSQIHGLLPRVNQDLLRLRGQFERGSWLSVANLRDELKHLIDTVLFFSRRAMPIAAGQQAVHLEGVEAAGCQVTSRTFDSDQLSQLRHRAARLSVTVNDLIAQALMLTIRDWNHERGGLGWSDRLRLMIPVNLRSRSDLEMPATNRTSYAFVERSVSEMEDVQAFLRGLNLETSQFRRRRTAERTLARMSALAATGVGLKIALSKDRCLATSVLSSVGDPTRRFRSRFPRQRGQLVAGNVTLAGLTAVVPIRPLTRATFFLNTYANRLNVGVHLDTEWFGPADAEQFLEQLTGYLDLSPIAEHPARAA